MKPGHTLKATLPPPAVVPALAAPVPLTGSSTTVIVNDMPACLAGDELPMVLRVPLPYTAPPFTNPDHAGRPGARPGAGQAGHRRIHHRQHDRAGRLTAATRPR